VRGAFRQADALGDWARLAAAAPPLVAVDARLTVTTGTYVRALAEDMGARLGCGALLFALRRTRVGPFAAERAHPG
jgi:tRNA pseudouridine55 synthase